MERWSRWPKGVRSAGLDTRATEIERKEWERGREREEGALRRTWTDEGRVIVISQLAGFQLDSSLGSKRDRKVAVLQDGIGEGDAGLVGSRDV